MTLFLEKLVNSKTDGNSSATVITVIPLSLGLDQANPTAIMQILNSVVVDSVIAHLEQFVDPGTVQALEYHLNKNNTSMSLLCQCPQKISDVLYELFGEGANIIVEKLIFSAFKTLGFKWVSGDEMYDKRTKLAKAFATLRRMVLDANKTGKEV